MEVKREISLKFLTWEEFKKKKQFIFRQYDTGYEVVIDCYCDEYIAVYYNARTVFKSEFNEIGYSKAVYKCIEIFKGEIL